MNVVAHTEDVALHLRIPAMLLMAKMHTCFEQLAHGKIWQCHCVSPLPVEPPRSGSGVCPPVGTEKILRAVLRVRITPDNPGASGI